DSFKNISIYPEHKVIEKIKKYDKCVVLNSHDNKYQVTKFITKKVKIAAGWASGLYNYVTNDTAVNGSEMIMAYDICC
ncbi:L-aspartate oxidase, partial [Francisella tularensis subsp. holarctica]|nr:L-aspartate oxidase [Francisella tularensis subsp. holarctica]